MNKKLFCFYLLLSCLHTVYSATSSYSAPGSCTEKEYYDTPTYTCTSCPQYLAYTPETYNCTCSSGYTVSNTNWIGFKNNPNLCVTCSSVGYVCSCSSTTQALISYTVAGLSFYPSVCTTCDSNSAPSSDLSYCEPCSDPLMTYDSTKKACACPSTSGGVSVTYGGDLCYTATELSVATFSCKKSLLKMFKKSYENNYNLQQLPQSTVIYGCSENQDRLSCYIAANMCTMQLQNEYNTVCKYYETMEASNGNALKSNNENYYAYLNYPWLYYYNTDPSVYTFNTGFYTTVSIGPKLQNPSTETYYLDYYIAYYDVLGNLIYFKLLDTDFMLCPSSTLDGTQQRTFGNNYENSCTIDLTSTLSGYTMYFYELYIYDYVTGEYVDVPVAIQQMVDSSGATPNSDATSPQRFVRRFFILDNISSRSTSLTDTVYAIRFAQSIQFEVTLRSSTSQSIYVPYVFISYADSLVSTTGTVEAGAVYITYEAIYNYNPSSFWKTADIILILFGVVAAIIWIIKSYVFVKYNPEDSTDYERYYTIEMVFNCLMIAVDIGADFLFFYLVIMTGYWFIFYKIYKYSFILIPSTATASSNYSGFELLLVLIAIFKLAGYLHRTVWRKSQIDLFFIDWERGKERIYQQGEKKTGLSAWRTLFVANELNELQTERLLSIEWTLFIVGFFMSGLNFENLAAETPQFDFNGVDKIYKNIALKFFIGSFVYLAVGFVQMLGRSLLIIWWPLEIQDFIDLCTVANTSIIFFDETCHGYYLHGKTPSGVAEGNTDWLDLSLKRESRAAGGRGFVKGEEHQTFEIIISDEFRKEYDGLFKKQAQKIIFDLNVYKGNLRILEPFPKEIKKEQFRVLEAYRMAAQDFLKKYLNDIEVHSSNHVGTRNMLFRVLGYPQRMPEDIRGLPLFYRDTDLSIYSLFYSGNTFNLLIFNIISYAFLDYLTGSTLVGIVLTYIVDFVLAWLRGYWGRRNISSKALVPEIFLI